MYFDKCSRVSLFEKPRGNGEREREGQIKVKYGGVREKFRISFDNLLVAYLSIGVSCLFSIVRALFI